MEDGRGDGISEKLAQAFGKKILAAGTKKSVRVLKASNITGGKRLAPQDERLLRVTHVVTGLKTLGARGVLEGLGVIAAGDPAPAALPFPIVTPDWLTACFQEQRLVDTEPYKLPAEPKAPPAPAAQAAQAAQADPPTAPTPTGNATNPPPRTHAEIEALLDEHFPDLDPETRAAYIAWGGPLAIRVGKDMPPYACQRPTPRQHPNRHITAVFEEVHSFYRALDDEESKERAKQWGRVLGVLRVWPHRITDQNIKELDGAPYIGKVRCTPARCFLIGFVNMPNHGPINPSITCTEHEEGGDTDPGARHHGAARGLPDQPAGRRAPGPLPHPPGRSGRSYKRSECCVVILAEDHPTNNTQVGAATVAKWYAAGYHSVQQIMDELDAAPDGDYTQTPFYQ